MPYSFMETERQYKKLQNACKVFIPNQATFIVRLCCQRQVEFVLTTQEVAISGGA
ncbi:hypothetical protein N480_16180 [Pseudoalteromonas luteoviolacea S2607]|uniref:Uncharacterized protein n=1 Tax=Pseudoalteromonas luteoviolacea S4060-1 TaxID=1365257 RepID=A0A167MU14_9GAMM|nr:hypothetical protein N480_16180 [Pseudoalteromonas luteoviolacea S2607]KZN66941.1 hypothetical protein N478_19120 [Pseudoalteromonas luteoviolacea S4060-1]